MRPICAAPETGHDGGLAAEGAGGDVGAFDAFIILGAGEDQVLVAGDDDVDALDGCQLQRGVFSAGNLIGGDAGMGEGDDDIGAFFLHLGHVGGRGFDDIAGGATLPVRWVASQVMIWGGRKPMKPSLMVLVAPAPSTSSFSTIR
jgi:hypothetical protein